jgi:mannonate dehydratase
MNRRQFLKAAPGSAMLSAGLGLSWQDGVFNACLEPGASSLSDRTLVEAAWRGLEPANVWDMHCHVFGTGDSGRGLWFNPRMERFWYPSLYAQRMFYSNAACVPARSPAVDAAVVERLLAQCEAMPAGFRVLLFAFDWARDENGAPMEQSATFYVPDDYVADLASRHPGRFAWAASIHPLDPRALDRLDAAAARGARAIKWLPSAQGIDPADARCDRFYARMAALGIPLISHAGDERAVIGFSESLGNPLRLRRALDAGVRVVVAHCASLGEGADLDRGGTTAFPNFDLFARLMDDPRYRSNLVGDISAVIQGNRMDVIPTLLERNDWHDRLLNGSDYPLPGIVPLVSLPALVERGLLEPSAAPVLRELRDHNVLLFDFVLKRSLAWRGGGFPRAVFETRRYFDRSA